MDSCSYAYLLPPSRTSPDYKLARDIGRYSRHHPYHQLLVTVNGAYFTLNLVPGIEPWRQLIHTKPRDLLRIPWFSELIKIFRMRIRDIIFFPSFFMICSHVWILKGFVLPFYDSISQVYLHKNLNIMLFTLSQVDRPRIKTHGHTRNKEATENKKK